MNYLDASLLAESQGSRLGLICFVWEQGWIHANMQDILANVDHIKFDLEIAVQQQLGAQPLPFPGMDSKWIASWHGVTAFYAYIILSI